MAYKQIFIAPKIYASNRYEVTEVINERKMIDKILSEEEMKFIELMKKYNVKKCYYGHLHGNSIHDAIEGKIQGIELKLVSADGLDFKLIKI